MLTKGCVFFVVAVVSLFFVVVILFCFLGVGSTIKVLGLFSFTTRLIFHINLYYWTLKKEGKKKRRTCSFNQIARKVTLLSVAKVNIGSKVNQGLWKWKT